MTLIRGAAVLAATLMLPAHAARAGCDLDMLIGYQLAFAKVVTGYVQDGRRQIGFEGCTRERVLLFEDNTGVRCKETFPQHAVRPKAYLFARSQTDLKLCIGDDLYEVAPPQ
jgi:hypothetical protein